MTPGLNVQDPRAPFQMIPPELLAQLAQASFRPPQPMQMHPMAMPQQQRGFGIGEGLQAAGGLMSMAGGLRGGWTPTSGGATPGVPTSTGDPTGGAGPAFLGGTSPIGGQPDFLTGLLIKLGLR